MSMSSDDESQIVEEPTPTKNKRPAPTGKGGKTKKAKSSVTVKSELVKGAITQRLWTRTQGKVAHVTTVEGSGESDSWIPLAGTSKELRQKHPKPEMSRLSEDTETPIPPFLLRYEANRKSVLGRDRKYPEYKKCSVIPHSKQFATPAAEECYKTSAAPGLLQLDSKFPSMFGIPTESRLLEIVHDFNLLMKMAKSIQSRITVVRTTEEERALVKHNGVRKQDGTGTSKTKPDAPDSSQSF
ncbi:unnamed protein product [Arabis nemorensis]|uniref:Uncharacterized protein n=1 Tax=Arabis nemorensis TaxID=586526 RepID=A0A565BKJ6_9BRAS|nr:unnamed protein product [Arabis nemorensis]